MDIIHTTRVVPVAVISRTEDAVPLARTLRDAGANLIEVTFRTAAAAESIKAILKEFPDMLVGAGTLLTPEQVAEAADAGARFGVAPGLNERVVRKAHEIGMEFCPGVMTPSEVEKALELGCKLLKFFPAEAAGGTAMLKALGSPFGHTGVKFIPLGGVNAKNAPDYLALPIVAAIGGSWIVDKKLVDAGNWEDIGRLTAEAVSLAKG